VVQYGETTILVDAGMSAKQICIRLETVGVNVDSLDGIVLTHEHSDHTKGVDVLLRKRGIPVYANAMTREAMQDRMKSEIAWRMFQNTQDFTIGELTVSPFNVPHDAAEPVGFVVASTTAKLGVLTDAGYVTQGVRHALRGLDAIFVEANYDMGLLEADTKRPWSIKQRISSRHGHLSNDQTAELLKDIATEQLKHVVLGHLSSDCNAPDVAMRTISAVWNELTHERPSIICATQDDATPWVEVGVKMNPLAALDGPLEQAEFL